MQRLLEDRRHRAFLDDPAEVHHGDALAEVAHDAEVVRDEDEGELAPVAQLVEQDQDLRLHADVERRHRLVGDDEVGPERERAGDADALALAARELVRIAARRRGRQADLVEQAQRPRSSRRRRGRCRAP